MWAEQSMKKKQREAHKQKMHLHVNGEEVKDQSTDYRGNAKEV